MLLLILDLLSSQVIILDERIVGHRLILLITFGMLILLVDQLLGRLAELPLLLPVVVMIVLVLVLLLLHKARHMISLTDLILSVQIVQPLLLIHCLLKFLTVTARLINFRDCTFFAFALVCLCLALNHGAPLIKATSCICRVVPLVVLL